VLDELAIIVFRSILVVGCIVLLTRVHGLRSFSKLSGFDFAITVSIGSILAGAVTSPGTPWYIFVSALVCLFALQFAMSQYRVRGSGQSTALDNAPMLILENGDLLENNMRRAGVTHADLWAKLREANAYDLSTVHAVVVETTGDVSVLHGPVDGPKPDRRVMQDVDRGEA
jgi:uncharacterized membrane protein YcaP (DUF421 family)